MTDKKWEELQIKDDFMFGIIMRNPPDGTGADIRNSN